MGMKDDEGIFKVLFLGDFNTEKSTIINALIGDELLSIDVLVNTTVIHKVLYGRDTENIKMYKNGSENPEIMPLDRFEEEYRLTDEDIFEMEENGGLGRLSDVDYVAFESAHDLFLSGLQFIDTPGLADAVTRSKAANIFIPQADAVEFVLSATHLFSNLEKRYIESCFAYVESKSRNVFFVVNHMNQANDPEAILRQCKKILRYVFTIDEVFDKELYDNRVFFINAHDALQMRKEGNEPVGTGMIEFQAALEALRVETINCRLQKNNTINQNEKRRKKQWELRTLRRNQMKYSRQ